MDKQKISRFLKKMFLRNGVYKLIRTSSPNPRVSILRYHSVVEPGENFYTSPAIALSPAEFERHVKFFTKNYTVLSLDQVIDSLQQKKSLPKNSVVFTFDDGYADNLIAANILRKYGANGTFFITTEPIGRESIFWLSEVTYLILKTEKEEFLLTLEKERGFPLTDIGSRWKAVREVIRLIKSHNREVRENIRKQVLQQLGTEPLLEAVQNLILTWEQVREMQDMGMIFGSHTLTHLNLPNADPEDAIYEITDSRKVLEKRLGKKIRHFSYPNSGPYEYFNERIRQYVVDAGYESSCTSNNGFVDHGSDPFALERVRTVPQLEEVIHGMEWDRVFGG